MFRSKHLLFWFILATVAALGIEGVSLVSLHVLREAKGIEYRPQIVKLTHRQQAIIYSILGEDPPPHIAAIGFREEQWPLTIDPLLGRRLQRNWEAPDGCQRTNEDGMRGSREYQPAALTGTLRIAAFGDSFIYGSEVCDDDVWTEVLRRRHRNWEILNFGVPGYGPDQAYLQYLDAGHWFQSDIVIIGFLSENIRRMLNAFSPFRLPAAAPITKPRFSLNNQQLTLVENPLRSPEEYRQLLTDPDRAFREIGREDYFYRTSKKPHALDVFAAVRLLKIAAQEWSVRNSGASAGSPRDIAAFADPSHQAYGLTIALLQEFHASVLLDGAQPVIVLLPRYHDVFYFQKTGVSVYGTLKEELIGGGYGVLDLMEEFSIRRGKDLEDLYVRGKRGGHFSPKGNQIFANVLERYIETMPQIRLML